jgi:hypothetical protein
MASARWPVAYPPRCKPWRTSAAASRGRRLVYAGGGGASASECTGAARVLPRLLRWATDAAVAAVDLDHGYPMKTQ